MRNNNILIAIDGPAASGKGTIAKKLAEKLFLKHLDTGKIYRAVAKKVLINKIDLNDVKKITEMAENLEYDDLKDESLDYEEIGNIASQIAPIKELRDKLLKFQQDFAKNNDGAIVEGRDIGTVICPDANFKIFITAGLEERAKRRFNQLQKKGFQVIYNDILKDLKERDERDMLRQNSPLQIAKDAFVIDTSELSIDQVLDKILNIVN